MCIRDRSMGYVTLEGEKHVTDGTVFSIVERPYFQKMLAENKRTVISDSIESRANGRNIILIVTKIVGRNGELKGYLSGAISLEYLHSVVNDAGPVSYTHLELYTQCRNLPQVHTIVRMMRMIGEIVCPSVLLLGEVVMEPEKVLPYFGTVDKPECHMLYNVTTMATTWHTVATREVKLLKKQLDIVNHIPNQYVCLLYTSQPLYAKNTYLL